jgi:hypothetical protein
MSYPLDVYRDLYRGERICPVDNAVNCACVGPNEPPAVPVDVPEHVEAQVGELREYEVEINGNRTTMRLTEEDAKRYGAVEVGQAPAADTKAQTSTQNKAATPANKSGGTA